MSGGQGWLVSLADAIKRCELFIPFYSPHYLESDFCGWELQLAILRDPQEAQGSILPILRAPVQLPDYCRLIQAQRLSKIERLEELVLEVLNAKTLDKNSL